MISSSFQFTSKFNALRFLTLSWGLVWLLARIYFTAADLVIKDKDEDVEMKFPITADYLSFNSKVIFIFAENRITNDTFLGRITAYSNLGNKIVSIKKLRITDSGIYTVYISAHTLEVQGPPVFKLNGNELHDFILVEENNSVNIICEKSGSNSSELKITQNSTEFFGKTQVSPTNNSNVWTVTKVVSRTFSLKDVDEILHCSSDNSHLETQVTIDVKVKPNISIILPNTLQDGLSSTITCVTLARPKADVTWMLNGNVIVTGENIIKEKGKLKEVTSNLRLTPTKKDNNKTISCITDANVSVEKTLNVTYPPSDLEVNPHVLIVKNGSESSNYITCSGDSNPLSTFQWSFLGKIVANESKLTFAQPVTLYMNGTYTCIVSNQHGANRITAEVNVLYPPRCKNLKKTISTKDLICEIESNPESNYTWYSNNNVELAFTKTYSMAQENSTFYCIGTNHLGSSERCEYHIFYHFSEASSSNLITIVITIVILSVLLLTAIIIILFIRHQKAKKKAISEYDQNHSERNNMGPDLVNTSDNIPIYAPIIKKNKKKALTEETTYQNVGRVDESVYQNVGKPAKPPPPKKNTGDIVYADLDIAKLKSDSVKLERKEQPTEYASIDFTKKAPPIEMTKKPEPIYCNSTTMATPIKRETSTFAPTPPRRTLQSDV